MYAEMTDHGRPDEAERTPPASLEAEQSVLGCLLADNSRMPLVADLVQAESFYYHQHRAVFAAIDELFRAQQPADVVTVHEVLVRRGLSEEVGGGQYLLALEMSVPSGSNARRYAEIVAQRYAERVLIAAGDEVVRLSWDTATPLADRMDRIAAVVARADQLRQGVGTRIPVLSMAGLRETAERVRWCV